MTKLDINLDLLTILLVTFDPLTVRININNPLIIIKINLKKKLSSLNQNMRNLLKKNIDKRKKI